jgi:hypothetical protein
MAETAEETGSSYSPLLAQMLKLDPDKIGSVSLSALGKQAYGADSEDYKKARAEVERARTLMESALEDRKGRIDPSMLALAQGFLAPTRTGSFGESLGTAVGGYSKAQEAEGDRNAQLAKMRYDLALQSMNEEKQAAQLGLNVVSKLTPKMTAYQQQVQSEGIDPRSPQGVARVKDLLATDKATPEQKDFAAQSGLPLNDPAFAAQFRTFQTTKPLRDVAARMGLNPENPEDRVKIQAQMQRESFAAQNKEVAEALGQFGGDPQNPADLAKAQKIVQASKFRAENKLAADALQTFGGDPLNPQDLARANRIVAENLRLEQDTKNVSMAAMRAQTTRTKQEIDDHIRTGNVGAIAQTAAAAGVPVDPRNPYAGLNKIDAAKKREADLKESGKYIKEKVAPFVQGIDADITDLQRALDINKEISTGVTYGLPGVGGVAKVLSGDRAKINEFDSLAALAAKQNRIPGDSNVSNLDVKMMQLGAFSSDKEPSTNDIIIKYKLAQRMRDRDYNAYITNFAAVNGAITPYAEAQWRKYLDANPLTARDAKGRVIPSPTTMTFQQYFSAPRVQVDAQGREVAQ